MIRYILCVVFLTSLIGPVPVVAQEGIIDKTVQLVDKHYLWERELSAKQALIKAAESLESKLPWLIVRHDQDALYLEHGQTGRFATLSLRELSYQQLSSRLKQLARLIKESAHPVDEELDLEVTILRGVARSLDRYSTILHHEGLRRFNERIRGKLSGIGCKIKRHQDGLRITRVFSGGAASRVDVRDQDVITHVDGSSIRGLSVKQGGERLRGPPGSKVEIQISREGETLTKHLVRRYFRIPNVHWSVEDDVGVIKIDNFSKQTARWLTQALKAFKAHRELRGVVLDLRGNTGGSMIQAFKVVDAFVDQGAGIRTVGRDGKPVPKLVQKYTYQEGGELKLPLLVLINKKSASSSEIVAGALKLAHRALLIGSKTHGKGVIQVMRRVRALPKVDQVKLKLTVAQYLLANDYSVHEEEGVTPHAWVTPHVFGQHRAYLSREIKGLVYTVERSGWRTEEPELRDFIKDFAVKLLNLKDVTEDVETLKRLADELSLSLAREEDQRVINLYEARDINWISGRSSPKREDLELIVSVVGRAKAGEDARVRATVINRGDQPLFRSRVYLKADSSRAPWHNTMISVGYVPPRGQTSQEIVIPISARSSSRIDKITPLLYASHLGEQALPPAYLKVEGASTPLIEASVYLISEERSHTLHLSITNTSQRSLIDVSSRLGLPNLKSLEFKSDGRVEIPIIEPGLTQELSFTFASRLPLDQIPSLQLRIDTQSKRRVIVSDLKPSALTSPVRLSPPRLTAQIPQKLSEGEQMIPLILSDDGHIHQSVVWLDKDKIGWRGERDRWEVPLKLTSGSHTLRVDVEDDQHLITRAYFPIYVEASRDAKKSSKSSEVSPGASSVER